MMKTLMTAMKTSISEVLETMFFLPVEIGGEKPFAQTAIAKEKSSMACQLKFTGDVNGMFVLIAPENLLLEITENFLGESREAIGQEHISGTLTEMLNMICGNALSKIKSKKPFELDIPGIIDSGDIQGSQAFTLIETPRAGMAVSVTIE